MKNILYLLLFAFCALPCTSVRAQAFDLELDVANAKRMNVTESPAGTYAIATTGNDPWIATQAFRPGPYDPAQVYVISFDYLAPAGLDFLEIFYGAVSPVRKATFTDLPATNGTYRTFKAFMKYEVGNWDSPFQQLRFDFSKTAGANITVRNLQLRAPAPTEVIELDLNPAELNANATTVTPDGNGGYVIKTSGNDPYVASQPFTDAYDPNNVFVLTFDYQSEQDLDDFRVFFGEPWTPARMSLFGPLPASPTTTRFTGFMQEGDIDWLTAAVSKLRFDFGRQPGKTITVSNFVLREPTNAERNQFTPPVVVETVDIELDVNLTSGGLTATKLADGSYQLVTSGNDPWIRAQTVTELYDIDSTYILTLEYKTEQAYNVLEFFYGPPIFAGQLLAAGELPAAGDWTTFTVNPRLLVDNFQDKAWTDFRFDLGKNEGTDKEIFVRNIQLRKPTAQEVIDERTSDKFVSRAINEEFRTYLNATFASSVDVVKVDTTAVTVMGTMSGSGEYFLAEILPQEYGFNQDTFSTVLPLTVADGTFSTRIDRFDPRSDRDYDRLYSRWAIVTATGPGTYALASFTSWPTDIAYIALNNLPEDKAKTIKGLDGLGERTIDNFDDLVDLDIKSMKINLLLNGVYSLNPSALTHEFNGKNYNINQAFVERLDASIKRCTDSDIKTALVLLVPLNIGNEELRRLFVYPDAIDAGSSSPYSMANVATAEGVETYTAMIDFLSQRYSRPDKLYGRMDQWIIHNEVDAHTNWTYAGQKPYQLYTEIYDRSMRMVHYTIRKHNPTAKVFASFTKHWNSVAGSSANFKSRDILDVLTRLTTREGDYEWNIGWHSYPTNLFNPKVWEDSPAKTPLNLNAQEITPRNLEMIDAYVRQEKVLYNGKKVRTILLSENGFSSNPERNANANETTQAAALAYFWKKASGRLPSIENIQLHRWVDNPNEAGLEFGLWTVVPGTFDGFNEKKEGWYVWNAAGTNEEDAVLDPYKATIGISDWSEIQFQVPTETTPHRVVMNLVNCDASLDDVLVSFNGEHKFPQSAGFVDFYNVASNVPQPYVITKGGTIVASDTLFVSDDLELLIDLQVVTGLTALATSPTSIDLRYSGGDAGATYIVERSTAGGTFAEVGRTNEQTYTDAPVVPGTDYAYRVAVAYTANTQSCYSDEVAITAPALVVDYRNGDLGKPLNKKITPILRIRNVSDQPVALNGLTARYWFTTENTLPLKFHVDEEISFAAGISGRFVALDPVLGGANYYLEITFDTDYLIAAGGDTGSMRFKISANKNNCFDERDDYSYAEVRDFVQTDRITLYRSGELIWGLEPGAVYPPVTPTSPTARATPATLDAVGDRVSFLFPNPATTYADLRWFTIIDKVDGLELINALGARVAFRQEVNGNRLRIRFNRLPRGVYLLTGSINGEILTRRLLIGN